METTDLLVRLEAFSGAQEPLIAEAIAEIAKLRAEADERDRSFAIFFRHYLRALAEVEDGPDKADLLQMIREQAATIRQYQSGPETPD